MDLDIINKQDLQGLTIIGFGDILTSHTLENLCFLFVDAMSQKRCSM